MSQSQSTKHINAASEDILNGNRQTLASQLTYSIPPTLPKLPQDVQIVQIPSADNSVYMRPQILQFTSIAQNQRITIPPQNFKSGNKIMLTPIGKYKEKLDKQVDKPAVRGVVQQQSRLRNSNNISNLGNSLVPMLDILAKESEKIIECKFTNSSTNVFSFEEISKFLLDRSINFL